MKFNVQVKKHILKFKFDAGTSRGVLKKKTVYYVLLSSKEKPTAVALGECSFIPGLSIDKEDDYEQKLVEACEKLAEGDERNHLRLIDYPSIRFGIETALLDFKNQCKHVLFPSPFTNGRNSIQINGLVWMGSMDFMQKQVAEKLSKGIRCIKLKIGGLNIEEELSLIQSIREIYSPKVLEIRVDANGAFTMSEIEDVLNRLGELKVHSIEQPIMPGQFDEMAYLAKYSPVPIALDEELIAIKNLENKEKLVELIKPQYLILKPSLLGGFAACDEWITIAKRFKVEWWVTSALESNIGLNAIAQWVAILNNDMPQGLGTGMLYTNNIASPLYLVGDKLNYNVKHVWDNSYFQ